MNSFTPRPVKSVDRISSLDVIRGAALLGILLMNVVGFGLPFAYNNPHHSGGADGLNFLTWQITSLFFEGTMRGLFSMLFGAGIVLMTSRAEARDPNISVADVYFRRNLWLVAFGLVHAWLLLFPGDILYRYGVVALFLFAFRKLSPKTLIVLGILVLASTTVKDIYWNIEENNAHAAAISAQAILDSGAEISDAQQDAIDSWKEKIDGHEVPAEDIDEMVKAKQGGYFENIANNAEGIIQGQSYELYMFTFADAAGMMLIGMALLKLGVLNAERSNRFYLTMMAVGYGVGLSVNAYEMNLLVAGNFGYVAVGQSFLTFELGRVPITLGHVGLVMLICRNGWLNWLTSRLAAVGQMALTNYISHSIICAIVFLGIGFSLYGELQRYQLYYVVFAIWIFQLTVSPIWLRHFRFGPLEWLWRSLTYREKQPMRRAAQTAQTADS
ncbi:MAG: DUF418 domain-containing protein [Woeseiaceae bacterium]